MSDDLDKLMSALKGATPEPDDVAQNRAIDAGMEAFEKNFQGSADGARPTREQAQWWALITRGANDMFRRLSTREALMTTASLATIAVAVVVTGQFSKPVSTGPDIFVTEYDAVTSPSVEGVIRTESEELGAVVDVEIQPETAPALPELEIAAGSLRTREPAPSISEGFAAALPAQAPLGIVSGLADQKLFQEPAPVVINTERFPDAGLNPLKIASEDPVSTFSIDVDTASYSFLRASLMQGHLPPADSVRTEELINYFSYDYPVPAVGEAPFTTSVSVIDTPWNEGTKLLHIGIKGYEIAAENRPPVNLVFLIDTSGSMQDPDKLPLLISSFRLMLSELGPEDSVAIVTYAGSAGTVLEPTPANERATIMDSLNRLYAGGSTAGQAGLQQAYALAEQMAGDDAIGRVILATDGDFNVGISDPEALKEYVEDKRDSGVYLSVLGFGRGNYNDALMQTLAQNGNGTASYIDTLAEAQKVLVDQIGGALFTIAQDVKIQVEFNPAEIAEYRLIGYETRALNREDFNNDTVDAGEIGAGHTVTAIYEITPVGSPAVMVDDLRYATDEVGSLNSGEYAFLKLRYKTPGEATSTLITTPILPDANAGLDSEVAFAAAVAGFGQILRGDDLMHGWTIGDALTLAQTAKGEDPFGYRAELLTLMRLAQSLK
ncbi:MAG: vWA domain-containing protein [Alphaproteobacteria bacterium]